MKQELYTEKTLSFHTDSFQAMFWSPAENWGNRAALVTWTVRPESRPSTLALWNSFPKGQHYKK